MSLNDLWKSEKLRESVANKIDEELKKFNLEGQGEVIENAISSKSHFKCQYLGYSGKIILRIRNLISAEVEWLHAQVREILSKPPPKLRKVLTPDEIAKYNKQIMQLNRHYCKLQEKKK